jgi:hypothetical protein
MNIGKVRSLFLPFTIATVFSLIGRFGMPDRTPTYLDAIPGVSILEAFFALPGGFFAVAVAAVFSPQGFHGGDQFLWIVLPANWIIYFGLTIFVRSLRIRKADAPGPPG